MPRQPVTGFVNYPLQPVALGLLMSGPAHGYALYQSFQEQFGTIWKAGQTKFYVALNRLEDEGLLSATLEPQEGRPDRKVYHLTEVGTNAFMKWLHEPVGSLRAFRVEFVAKLRFFNLLKLKGSGKLIALQSDIIRAMVDEWEARPTTSDDPFYELVLDYRLRQARFMLDWLDACADHLGTLFSG